MNIEILDKCYATVLRLADRIGIDGEAVRNFTVVVSEPVMTVTFRYGDYKHLFTGHSICMRGDKFDFDIGLNIAIARAMRKAHRSDAFAEIVKVAKEIDDLRARHK